MFNGNRHTGVGGKSDYGRIFCPSGYSHFIDACIKIAALPADADFDTADADCKTNSDTVLTIRSFLLNEGIKIYLGNVSSTSSIWVGKYADLEDEEPMGLEDLWSEGGQDANEDCVKADQTDDYRWKRVPCSDTATYICEAKSPDCPPGYNWVPDAGTSSCFKLSDETESTDARGVMWSSINTGHKICMDEGTRLATPTTDSEVAALAEFMRTLDILATGDQAADRHTNVWMGLQYFKQELTIPATCTPCQSSPDWENQWLSPWSNSSIPDSDGQTLFGSEFADNRPCYTLSAANVFSKSWCMMVARDQQSRIRALCEYRGCSTGTETCVFPFKLGGRLYNTCTRMGTEDGVPWCSTQVDENGVHVEGKELVCPSDCPVSDCPVGFNKHLKTCIQESASIAADAPKTVLDAEAKCVEQGARLYQPRSSRTINALKVKTPILYADPNSVGNTGPHRWAIAGGATQETALGITLLAPDCAPTLFYKDGSQLPNGLVEASLNWATGDVSYPTNEAEDTCVTLKELDQLSNNNCTNFSEDTLPYLAYICEARPFTTIDGDVPNKACHFPFRLEAGGEWHHSCVYDTKKGKNHVWCPTKVDDDGVVVKGETGICDDERNTAYDGPGDPQHS